MSLQLCLILQSNVVALQRKNVGYLDCPNGWDELNCGTCDFESNTCGWNDVSIGSYKWIRDRAGTSGIETGPPTDHTTETAEGKYLPYLG